MTALIISIATALAEAYLSKRLGGVRVKLDASKMLATFGDRRAGKKASKLIDAEARIRAQLARIRPAPQVGALARNERGELGEILEVITDPIDGSKLFVGMQLGDPAGKTAGGPWRGNEVEVVAHILTLK